MKLPIIQSLWIGKPLSKLEQLCIQSFLDNGHEFHLYVYGDVGAVPAGAIIKSAEAILPKRNIFRNNLGGLSGFANWFRLELLMNAGGFWVDTDVVCIKPFEFGDELVVGKQSHKMICNAVLGGQSELMIALREHCRTYPDASPFDDRKARKQKLIQRLLQRGREGSRFGSIGGPQVLTAAMQHFGIFDIAKPHTYFYPIHYENWDSIFDETYSTNPPFTEDTHTLHLWNEMLRLDGIDKNTDFPHNSLIEQLKRKHKIK